MKALENHKIKMYSLSQKFIFFNNHQHHVQYGRVIQPNCNSVVAHHIYVAFSHLKQRASGCTCVAATITSEAKHRRQLVHMNIIIVENIFVVLFCFPLVAYCSTASI